MVDDSKNGDYLDPIGGLATERGGLVSESLPKYPEFIFKKV